MQYTIATDEFTERELRDFIVSGIRAGVSKEKPIFVYMSFENMKNLCDCSLSIITSPRVGTLTWQTGFGEVQIEALVEPTNTITISN